MTRSLAIVAILSMLTAPAFAEDQATIDSNNAAAAANATANANAVAAANATAQAASATAQASYNYSVGVAGVQPYCSSYGTCPTPDPSYFSGPGLDTVIIQSLFGIGKPSQPQQIVRSAEDVYKHAPRTARHHHRRRYHSADR